MVLLLSLTIFANGNAAKSNGSEPGFSFVVYGDSRTEMYLPYKEDEQNKIYDRSFDLFQLFMADNVAKEMIKDYVKLKFDPVTKDLSEMRITTPKGTGVFKVNNGWVVETYLESPKNPELRLTIFRLYAGDWVNNALAEEVNTGNAKFVVNTGDFVWWELQGKTLKDSPYWQRFYELMIKKLSPADKELKAAGLNARFFPSVGNHEVWGDLSASGVITTFPYLKDMGVKSDRLIYKFDFKGARFMFLWTGSYDYKSPSNWDSTQPTYAIQMKQLRAWLDEAKASGVKKAFIFFHDPVFCRSSLGPIPEPNNPHKIIASYAKDFEDLIVFNGHIHTTEVYEVDGVKYIMQGSGGAEQAPIIPGSNKLVMPKDYPQELYWKGEPMVEDYNYALVEVNPGEKTKIIIKRFRPESATPFESVELFASEK
ncbi:MAG: metallophosphoesterase [Negativicutes bacterium]|jgi:hypothetical protein